MQRATKEPTTETSQTLCFDTKNTDRRTITLLLPPRNGIQSFTIPTLYFLTLGTFTNRFIHRDILEKDMLATSFCWADGTIELTTFYSSSSSSDATRSGAIVFP